MPARQRHRTQDSNPQPIVVAAAPVDPVTATTTRRDFVVHLFQRAGTVAIVAVLVAIGILWTAVVRVYLGGLVP